MYQGIPEEELMKIKHMSKVVSNGTILLLVAILLTAGSNARISNIDPIPPSHSTSHSSNIPPRIPPKTIHSQTGPQRNVAYFTQWGIYVRNYNVKDLDTSGAASKLTAINYAFAGISSDSKCKSFDAWADYQKHFSTEFSKWTSR